MDVPTIIGADNDAVIKDINEDDDEFLTQTYVQALEEKQTLQSTKKQKITNRKRKASPAKSPNSVASKIGGERLCKDCRVSIPSSKPGWVIHCMPCWQEWKGAKKAKT